MSELDYDCTSEAQVNIATGLHRIADALEALTKGNSGPAPAIALGDSLVEAAHVIATAIGELERP